MKIHCDYCDAFIDDTEEFCPNCGGVNSHLVRSAVGIPQTIEELKQWCREKNVPLEQARFFIGENYKGARAFGIYKDEETENFIVYKNKSDGSRAIRYEGKDEKYAVNEIFQKLKEEMLNQKKNIKDRQNSIKNTYKKKRSSKKKTKNMLLLFIVAFALLYLASVMSKVPKRGYYEYGNQMYYYQPSDGWYQYTDDDWNKTDIDEILSENYEDYYESGSYYDDYETSDFTATEYYYEDTGDSSYDSNWDSGWDDDSDWDSGWDSGSDWDSGTTDWDSDW